MGFAAKARGTKGDHTTGNSAKPHSEDHFQQLIGFVWVSAICGILNVCIIKFSNLGTLSADLANILSVYQYKNEIFSQYKNYLVIIIGVSFNFFFFKFQNNTRVV